MPKLNTREKMILCFAFGLLLGFIGGGAFYGGLGMLLAMIFLKNY